MIAFHTGIIYGGLVFVLNMLYMFLFLGLICGLCFLDCGDLRQKIDQFQERTYSSSSRNAEFIDTCNTVKTGLVEWILKLLYQQFSVHVLVATVVFVFLIILSAISATIGFCCIKGVETVSFSFYLLAWSWSTLFFFHSAITNVWCHWWSFLLCLWYYQRCPFSHLPWLHSSIR